MPKTSKNVFVDKVRMKVSEKWLDFSGLSEHDPSTWDRLRVEEQQEFEDLIDAERLLEAQAQTLTDFLRHPGWQLMEDYRVKRIEVLRSQLERLSVEDDKARDIKAELRVLRGYENFVLSKISSGSGD